MEILIWLIEFKPVSLFSYTGNTAYTGSHGPPPTAWMKFLNLLTKGQGRIPGKRQWLGINCCCQNKWSWLQCISCLQRPGQRGGLGAEGCAGSPCSVREPGLGHQRPVQPKPPCLGLLPTHHVSSGTLNYRASPLEKERIAISQIPMKASRGLACFIISSSLKPFWDLEREE